MCKDRQKQAKRFYENPISPMTPFPGLSAMHPIQSLQKWTYRHLSALVWGSVQSLQVRNNPEIYKTHAFYVTLALTLRPEQERVFVSSGCLKWWMQSQLNVENLWSFGHSLLAPWSYLELPT